MAYTPEELAQLTDEEREGLEDADLVDDETDEEEEAAPEAETEAETEEEVETEEEAKPAAEAAEEEQPTRDDGEDDEPADLRDPVPVIRTEAPADVEARLADIDKREDDLTSKFDDGDITSAEYRAELRKLERERGDIEKAQLKHDLATEFNEAQAEANWQRDVKQFLDAHPEVVSSKLRADSFDMVVRAVTAKTMEGGKLPGTADLEAAYKEWSEQLGIKPAAKDGGKPADPKPTDPKPAAAKPKVDVKPRPPATPTLANVPAAQVNDTDDGKWAHLDRLMESDPLGFEKAMAKMSEADREAYLAAS